MVSFLLFGSGLTHIEKLFELKSFSRSIFHIRPYTFTMIKLYIIEMEVPFFIPESQSPITEPQRRSACGSVCSVLLKGNPCDTRIYEKHVNILNEMREKIHQTY